MTPIIFSIPLSGERSEQQWEITQRRLAGTLASLANQSDPDWRAVITGHERPEISALSDTRVTFLNARFDKPADKTEFTRDKSRKQKSNYKWIAERGGCDVVMSDADDLFHRDFVAFIREQNHPNGHSIHSGYVFDCSSGHLSTIPGAWRNKFHLICGSSAVLRLEPVEMQGADCRLNKLKPHDAIFENSEAIGRSLNVIEWPAVIYVLGGLESVSANIFRTPERQTSLHEIIAKKAIAITDEIVRSFTLQPLINGCETQSSRS